MDPKCGSQIWTAQQLQYNKKESRVNRKVATAVSHVTTSTSTCHVTAHVTASTSTCHVSHQVDGEGGADVLLRDEEGISYEVSFLSKASSEVDNNVYLLSWAGRR